MLTNRLVSRFSVACAIMILAALAACPPIAAQDSATARSADDLDWTKLPQSDVEGVVTASACEQLSINTGSSRLIFRAGSPAAFRPPPGQHFVNFRPCLDYQGFRVRVTYTAPRSSDYDGDFRIVQILSGLPSGKGDDVPKFASGPDPLLKRLLSKPDAKWVAPPKPWSRTEGVVKSVVCSGQNLTMILDQSGFILKLHTDHHLDMPFSASGGGIQDGFNPCKDLRSRAAVVEYAPVKGQAYDGDLAGIEVKD